MYVTGLLMYEDLSLYLEAHKNMQQLKERREKKEAGLKNSKYSASPIRDRKSPIRTVPSARTKNEEGLFGTSGSIFGDDSGPIRQGNIGATDLGEIEENSNDSLSNSEDEKSNSKKHKKKATSPKVTNKPRTSKDEYSMSNFSMNNLAKVDSILNDNKTDNRRIKLPKLLVLVSKYPIYEDMEEFLKKIKV